MATTEEIREALNIFRAWLPSLQADLEINELKQFNIEVARILKKIQETEHPDAQDKIIRVELFTLDDTYEDLELSMRALRNQSGLYGTEEISRTISKGVPKRDALLEEIARLNSLVETQQSTIVAEGDFVRGNVAARDQYNVEGNQISNIENMSFVRGREESEEEVEEKIRLDVAYDKTGKVNVPFLIAVAVLPPEAPSLTTTDLQNTASATGSIFRAKGQKIIEYKLMVKAPNCKVFPEEMTVKLKHGHNSPIVQFFITAETVGTKQIMVNAYQDDIFAAQTMLNIEVQVNIQADTSSISEKSLRKKMGDWLDLSDIRQACFDMKIDHENISGATKTEKIISLIEYCQHKNRMSDIIDTLEAINPNRNWKI